MAITFGSSSIKLRLNYLFLLILLGVLMRAIGYFFLYQYLLTVWFSEGFVHALAFIVGEMV
ncbi:MAG: hypothetical protein ACJAT1_000705 [Marivirga sp.]|jgi:hypothetical protein